MFSFGESDDDDFADQETKLFWQKLNKRAEESLNQKKTKKKKTMSLKKQGSTSSASASSASASAGTSVIVPGVVNVQVRPVTAPSRCTNGIDDGIDTVSFVDADGFGNFDNVSDGEGEIVSDIDNVASSGLYDGSSSNYDVYHSYQELANAVTAHEIETITKYTVRKR